MDPLSRRAGSAKDNATIRYPNPGRPLPPDAHAESEWQTRKRRIETRLANDGWPTSPFRDGTPTSSYGTAAVPEYETAKGPANYAPAAAGRVLGIAEAKRLNVGPSGTGFRVEAGGPSGHDAAVHRTHAR